MPSWLTGLQFRLIAAFTLTLVLALGSVGAFVSFAAEAETDRFRARNHEFRVGRVHREIVRYYVEKRDWNGVQLSLEQAASFYGGRFMVTDSQGKVVGDSHFRKGKGGHRRNREARPIPIVIEGRPVGFLVLAPGEDSEIVPTQSPPVANLPAAAPPPREPLVSRVTTAVNHSLLWAGLVAGAGGILLLYFVSRRILAPVQALGAAARRLGQGDFSQRVPAAGPAEIRSLGDTFNVMASNLQAAEQQRRNLTADVAHELRTPLSNIQGYLDAVHDGLLEPDQATMAILRQQTTHLVALVEDLRLLAMAEAGSLVLSRQSENLAALLADSVEAFRPRADAKEIRIIPDIAGLLPDIDVDRTRIAQVVGNLLENAIFNTPEGGSVTVKAEHKDSLIDVSVSDTGPGIAPEDLPRLFDRFYRVDSSRSRATGGAGLGLTIARQLVEAHGGRIWVESSPGEGATFSFTIPLNRAAE